jgi:hypothetical protein
LIRRKSRKKIKTNKEKMKKMKEMKEMKRMKKQSAGLNVNNPSMKRSDWGQRNELRGARQASRLCST